MTETTLMYENISEFSSDVNLDLYSNYSFLNLLKHPKVILELSLQPALSRLQIIFSSAVS